MPKEPRQKANQPKKTFKYDPEDNDSYHEDSYEFEDEEVADPKKGFLDLREKSLKNTEKKVKEGKKEFLPMKSIITDALERTKQSANDSNKTSTVRFVHSVSHFLQEETNC